MWIFDHLKREGRTLRGAPLSFVIVAVAGFLGGQYWNAERMAVMGERLNFKDEQLKDAERRLSEKQIEAIQSTLRKYPGTVEAPASPKPGVEEQLTDAFKSSGWSVIQTESIRGFSAVEPAARTTISEALTSGGVGYSLSAPLDAQSRPVFTVE